jgi:hypothetical protein
VKLFWKASMKQKLGNFRNWALRTTIPCSIDLGQFFCVFYGLWAEIVGRRRMLERFGDDDGEYGSGLLFTGGSESSSKYSFYFVFSFQTAGSLHPSLLR